ncbi:hypothetical protein [Luteimonas mephitis]|uniref:hypothetical protein n=1 Tax=Luteimonas mephitis TaxID=83615 RepID=UPI0012EB1C8F|nr:hypothetical protein [Luteimonas mephitis]
MRVIDGFTVDATTEPKTPGAPFYEPALHVTKAGTDFDETTCATTQNLEHQTQAEALAVAERWLESIERVTYNGTLNFL